MQLTELGHFLRGLRKKDHSITKHMADNLGVGSAFLSGVENGKNEVPLEWEEKIRKLYHLTPEESQRLDTIFISIKAQKNLVEWERVYGDLKAILKQASDEDIEEYIKIAERQTFVRDRDELRKVYYRIREEE